MDQRRKVFNKEDSEDHGIARRYVTSHGQCVIPIPKLNDGSRVRTECQPEKPPWTFVVLRALRGKSLPALTHTPSHP
jgi:hypothetical protein